MSIAKILRKKEAEKLQTILSVIEREEVETVFNEEYLEETIKRLYLYTKRDKTERDRDELMSRLFEVIQATYSPVKRYDKVFHPSSIDGDCERRLVYEFLGEKPSDKITKKVEAKLQRTFDVGTWWHTYIQMKLWRAGILEKSEVRVANRHRKLVGSADGIVTVVYNKTKKRALLEIKTMNSFAFAKGKIKPFGYHETQAGVYATELGLELIVFIYINKDTSEIVEHVVEVNKNSMKKVYEKMDFVLDNYNDSTVPERVWCRSKTTEYAKKCPYATTCFKDPKIKFNY